jgi:hypothetical protein
MKTAEINGKSELVRRNSYVKSQIFLRSLQQKPVFKQNLHEKLFILQPPTNNVENYNDNIIIEEQWIQ